MEQTTAVGQAQAALAAVRALADLDPGEVSGDDQVRVVEVLAQVAAVAGSITAGVAGRDCFARAVEGVGWASPKDFLTATTGGFKGSGPGLVKLSHRLESMPATAQAMGTGWLSPTKAQVITAKVHSLPHHTGLRAAAEADLLELARVLDATELIRTWDDVLERIDPDGELLGSEPDLDKNERAAHHNRTAAFGETRHGGGWFKMQSTIEDIALIKETLLPLTKPVQSEPGACGGTPGPRDWTQPSGTKRGTCPDPLCSHDGSDPREHGARLVDAMVDACRRLQTLGDLPETHGAKPRVMVTTTLHQLRADTTARVGGQLLEGQRLSVAAVRRLACDADVIPVVFGGGSLILDAGRAQRLVTTAIWLMLVLRDRHCAFPGCRRRPEACDAHHVVHWADGGPTNLANLVLLCRKHHTLIHQSPWQIRINPHDGLPEFHPPPRTIYAGGWIRERPPPMAA